ncbi:MAG TPA: sulfotransferase domain-containing protein [Gemmatimonadota bacterium]|nr:sulfotransferase domain-containing protein [Gemmatimonadota bacterium]
MPQFLIIGAMRGGTTTLCRHLVTHSKIEAAFNKEVHYFDKNFHRGLDWYRAFFPLRSSTPVDSITGEATPYYLFHPRCPRHAAKMLRDIRLIAVLRDPVERAFSHFQWATERGREKLSFEEALEAEEDRLSGEHERLSADARYTSFAHQFYSYKARGLYADQLERWFAEFDRRSIMVLKSESLFSTPSATIPGVLRFLGLPDEDLGILPHRNMGSGRLMDPRTRERLRGFFEPHNRRLNELLGWTEEW